MENHNELLSFAAISDGVEVEDDSILARNYGGGDEEIHEFNGQDVEESLEAFQVLEDEADQWDQNNAAVTNALGICSKYVLNPYNGFLKVIGWRKFDNKSDRFQLCMKVCNVVYPIFIFLMLLMACVTQLSSCFSRTRSIPPVPVDPNSKYAVLDCTDHVVSGDGLIYLFILIAYWSAFYLFRFAETEHLSALSQTVFISFSYINSPKKWVTSVTVLILFLVSGICWFCFSAVVNILRLIGLGLYKDTTIIEWFTTNTSAANQHDYLTISPGSYSSIHYTFVCFSMIGFIFFDFLYIAVVINYCMQCQLLIFFVQNIREKILAKKHKTLNDACKEVYNVYEFLKVLNGKLAMIMSLITFLCAFNAVSSYVNLSATNLKDKLNIVLGFLNVIQWLLALAFPIAMATRFTAISRSLRVLGLQIATRPFVYRETPDLDLQFFLSFMSTTEYQARLAFIPMRPTLVLGTAFVLLLGFSLGIGIPHVQSVYWF